jgi:predicted DNA-binding ribbon-helix-helix protein
MCNIYAQTDPIQYESRTRSVRISGVITNIRLENLFWHTLAELAEDSGVTTNQLIATLHSEVQSCIGEAANFASFLRVTCLRYQALRSTAQQGARAALGASNRRSAAASPSAEAGEGVASGGLPKP